MRLLTVAFGSPAEFLACYSPALSTGALFCPTRACFRVEDELMVEVAFPTLSTRTVLRGRAHTQSTGQGGWLRLDPADARAQEFVLASARGTMVDDASERSHLRLPASLPVDCRIDEPDELGERVISRTHDVGTGGVFIRGSSAPAVGTRVAVVLGPATSGGRFQLGGRVAWIAKDRRARGFGVRFDQRPGADGRRLRTVLRRAWESGRVEFTG
jgi:Tfp pilus assembly protein PilZ